MANFDVFNGDADGIISLVQLRLASPLNSTLITGYKRDINLLSRVDAGENDNVVALDISMRSNKKDLIRILGEGAKVRYIDHHNSGEIPENENLQAIINTSPEMCTAMLVDMHLDGAYRAWAVTAAFGDNFPKLAHRKSQGYNFPLESLSRLGKLINYNSYGSSLSDLLYKPSELYSVLVKYEDPMLFLKENGAIIDLLEEQYIDDMLLAEKSEILDCTEVGKILILENTVGSRRISGVFGNKLSQKYPNMAHAILTHQKDGYMVSIRSPIASGVGSDELALKFKSGGGRPAAAGINFLGEHDLEGFIEAFRKAF